MTISVRAARPGDRDIIADFNSRIAEETEDSVLDPAHIVPGVAALLADAAKGRYWLAVDGDRVIGQIMVTYEWSDWRNGVLWWIQSVYVEPTYRRRGVFSALYRHVESLARADRGVAGIRLYVEKDNLRAQATYESLGMTATPYKVMQSLFVRESD